MKKLISVLMLLTIFFTFAGCKKEDGDKTPDVKENIVQIRNFEDFDEIIHGVAVSEYFGSWDVNQNKAYITSGNGSMKICPAGNNRIEEITDPYIRIAPEMYREKYKFTRDFRKVNKISFDIYNDSPKDEEISVILSYETGMTSWGQPYTLDGERVKFAIKAKQWNKVAIDYDMTSLIDSYPIDKLHHIDIVFKARAREEEIPVYYLDNMALELSPYDEYIDFNVSKSVPKGQTVQLRGKAKDFNGNVTNSEVSFEIYDEAGKKIAVTNDSFKADKDRYNVKAVAKRNGKIVASNQMVVKSREKQYYGIIDDFNDFSDSSDLIIKNRRGVIEYDDNVERPDGRKGAVRFSQLRDEAGIGFSYKDFWKYSDYIESFVVEMQYRTSKDLKNVPVFKGLFRDSATEYLMYKSDEGTWAHNYPVNRWVDVELKVSELQNIMDINNNLPDETKRPNDYPALFIGFNSMLTNDLSAKIYFGNLSVKLKDFEGKVGDNISLEIPSLGIEGFSYTIKSVKNQAGNSLPFDSVNKSFNGSSGVYTVEYLIRGDTINSTNLTLNLKIV